MKPPRDLADTLELHLQYLDRYRDIIEKKLVGLSDSDLRSSRLPSGWTPLELLKHLIFMERRWLRWGFTGEQVEHPWGDSADDPDGPWTVEAGDTLKGLLVQLHAGGEFTRSVVAGEDPATVAAAGGRFTTDNRPTLNWILFHVLQEYARHAGHLDVARELADGATGE
ncbi:DinB family protein [Kribbella speibonae]|uniref:DinB family protein n=1 Tax=Kribbella speibonae TaxID=1572660 RepID=A0ABY1ZXQ6_9ACTN|nr:DinB family protein [Kribbella speibonae]TCC19683.1 DinB family protein [Kribbella speibonae]